jgi:hypothetical protein
MLDDGGDVNRCIFPMEKPPLLYQDRPLLPQVLHEDIQDLRNYAIFTVEPLRTM